jgi:WD40 repeat protein
MVQAGSAHTRPQPGGGAAGASAAGGGSKPKKAARDFSNLLDVPATYTPYKEEEAGAAADTDADATVVDMGGDGMAAMMGFAGFGKQHQVEKKKAAEVQQLLLEATRRDSGGAAAVAIGGGGAAGPAVPSGGAAAAASTGEGNDDDDDAGDEDDGALEAEDPFGIPVSHEATINHGTKPVSALDIDPSGARLATGGADWQLKFWDFAAMDARMGSFRSIEPAEGCQVRCMKFSKSGDMMLVGTGNAMPMIFDRDGLPIVSCVKGDQYFNDLSKTLGHVAMVNDCKWHPKKKNIFATCSADSTVRIWDTDKTLLNNTLKSSLAGKCRTKLGKRAVCVSVAWNKTGELLAVGCEGGSIQTFSVGERTIAPRTQQYDAHAADSTVTCVVFNRKGKKLLSRATDGTVKLWNPRNMGKGPLKTATDLPCQYSMTDAAFSPNEKMIVTGTSGRDVPGTVVFLDADTFAPVQTVGIAGGAIRIMWHQKINQIAVSTTDGKIKVLYDSKKSTRGAMFCIAKAPRKANALDALGMAAFGDVAGTIQTPHLHKKFREEEERKAMNTNQKRKADRKDGKKSMLPTKPIPAEGFGLGHQGRVQGYAPTLSMHLAKQTTYDKTRDEDPRTALLKYANIAAKEPMYVDTAYTMYNQPIEPVYSADMVDEDEQVSKKRLFDPEKKPFDTRNSGGGIEE